MRLQLSEAEASDRLEVGSIPGGQTKPVFDCGCCDEGVGEPDAALSADSAGTFGHRAIDRDLPERSKEGADQIGGGVAGEELGTSYDRVVQPVTAGRELSGASEVVDEDIGVDEDVSHDPSRPGSEP